MTIVVTGGAGFIGSNFVLDWIRDHGEAIVNIDKLTYAGNLDNLSSIEKNSRHIFEHLDICDGDAVRHLLQQHQPQAIVHFAAESHVDRSIHSPADFIDTNIVGTFRLLEAARDYWASLAAPEGDAFRFLHISTDEVYGTLAASDPPFSETSAYAPNSPYSASKAASDHLVRASYHTYGFPAMTGNCSNNYGPQQFPEKFIPLMIHNALAGKPIPIYGDGRNIRDWLYVADHCSALRSILERGRPGETYNIGGNSEMTNIDVAEQLCAVMDQVQPLSSGEPHASLIEFVADRPGHDRRYAVDAGKIEKELAWRPQETFSSGLEKTVRWYLDNSAWIENVSSGKYQEWISKNYDQRAEIK